MMVRFLVGLFAASFTIVSVAGLVEVNTSQYLRESGSPYAQTLEVTLENEGEIRISNINLQDADVELAESTQIYLNGSSVLSPFQVPYGGYAVFPLSAGTHYLEVTLRGKPGGGLEVAFYENKPDAPTPGIGFEILDDGTVLHRRTGLIWHRNPQSPGYPMWHKETFGRLNLYGLGDAYPGGLQGYVDDFNSGVFGEDPVHGNAGHSDWRPPSFKEALSLVTLGVSFPPLEYMDGSFEIGTNRMGDGFGKPFFICYDYDFPEQDEQCNVPYGENLFLWTAIDTTTKEYWGRYLSIDIGNGTFWSSNYFINGVWFVRGGKPD